MKSANSWQNSKRSSKKRRQKQRRSFPRRKSRMLSSIGDAYSPCSSSPARRVAQNKYTLSTSTTGRTRKSTAGEQDSQDHSWFKTQSVFGRDVLIFSPELVCKVEFYIKVCRKVLVAQKETTDRRRRKRRRRGRKRRSAWATI